MLIGSGLFVPVISAPEALPRCWRRDDPLTAGAAIDRNLASVLGEPLADKPSAPPPGSEGPPTARSSDFFLTRCQSSESGPVLTCRDSFRDQTGAGELGRWWHARRQKSEKS